ncbi:RNA-binding domain-containing protein [Obba rivulosa]|uniref:RNA-binding domain-containing protein n=1 Tax=Obba rivulosa TaxID=1052685 RepID=A0A8E2DSP3_9APHY|nr:RNA-binding domain-containing protein [Obba rivulosa]
MEEGTKSKKTIFVNGFGDDVDEAVLLETFVTFGDVIEVQIPPAATNPSQPTETKHRGFGFVTFASPADAQDAIDNMDLNELNGRVLKVSLARPLRVPLQGLGNRALWESEEWLKQYAKPLARSGGHALRAKGEDSASAGQDGEDDTEQKDEDDNAMEE